MKIEKATIKIEVLTHLKEEFEKVLAKSNTKPEVVIQEFMRCVIKKDANKFKKIVDNLNFTDSLSENTTIRRIKKWSKNYYSYHFIMIYTFLKLKEKTNSNYVNRKEWKWWFDYKIIHNILQERPDLKFNVEKTFKKTLSAMSSDSKNCHGKIFEIHNREFVKINGQYQNMIEELFNIEEELDETFIM